MDRVGPDFLLYDAAEAIKVTLAEAGFPDVEVAFPPELFKQALHSHPGLSIAPLSTLSIDIWNDSTAGLSEQAAEGEEEADDRTVQRRQEYQELVNRAKKKIEKINKLHNDVTRFRSFPKQRTIGFVLHVVETIAVGDEPLPFSFDWELIELHEEKIVWDSFKGNKVYVGGNLSPSDYGMIMFIRPEDQASHKYPLDGLLQAYGVVKDKGVHSPHLDASGHKCLLVVKNGLATGTTIGRVNGLISFTRVHTENGVGHTSIAVAALAYDKKRGAFSTPGDSGAIVLERGGAVVGMFTGDGGVAEEFGAT